MTEFEVERMMPANANDVFDLVSDLSRLADWLPGSVTVHPTGETSVHADVEPRHVHAEGQVRAERDQLRLEWTGDAGPQVDYAGWLQVMPTDEHSSRVALHLSFLGHQPETHGGRASEQIRQWMTEGLERLEQLVAAQYA